ncbi:ATP-binding protein [Pedobacter sp. PF22-3]|uniref:ATP-binding protein n=1 Tax=Pedobacter sp. PF22-3 TaxID=2994467 RepID=UPI00224845E3|nr:ATP-binding protein [Pedobacter sp. PF22-3]MCX2495907.1 ATP-binding protein [Pedobacter sp. PF22-3]
MSNEYKYVQGKDLFFQTTPGNRLSFRLEIEPNTTIQISGNSHGKIAVEGSFVTYEPNSDFYGTEKLQCLINDKKAIINVIINVGYAFKAKSHILSLLGDELIGSDNLAIFELVKNAYDADAENVLIELVNLNTSEQSISIEDDGNGMTPQTLTNVWLEIGTDFKRGIKRQPSKKFERISLGEKGVGRLAVHKLGKKIVLETKTLEENFSSRITINWQKLIDEAEYIQDTSVEIERIEGSLFPKKNQGTRIIISDLKKENWTRRDLRELARKTLSIINPFQNIDSFSVEINANDYHQSWFEDVKDPNEILNESLYYFDFEINSNSEIKWSYLFRPPNNFGIDRNSQNSSPEENRLKISNKDDLFDHKQKHLKESDLNGIGEIKGRFYVYNLLTPVLNAFGQTNAIKSFIRENSGVRVFRDGIRVYNYGEPGDDWLGLDLARVQKLGERFSKNTVIGSVQINMSSSHKGLVEKTNREGFDDNIYFKKFKAICNEVFDLFQRTAISDREKIKNYLEDIKPVKKIGFSETIDELSAKLKEKKLDKELAPLMKRVQKDYNDMRDVMVNSGMSGINLGIVFHEVDREVKFINTDLNNNLDLPLIKERVKNLIQLLENFSPLLKQNKNISIEASKLVVRAKDINGPRFGYHKIIFSSPLISGESPDFMVKGPGNLLLSSVSNIIDNSIYWVSVKKELQTSDFKSGIFITSDIKNFSGPAIIIADNGPGFNMEPEDLIFPFRTTRPGGMGLGLYFVNIVMEMVGGKLLFPDPTELDIPKVYNGAVVALVFPNP